MNIAEAQQILLNNVAIELTKWLGREFVVTENNKMVFDEQQEIDGIVYTWYESTVGQGIRYYFEVENMGDDSNENSVRLFSFVIRSDLFSWDKETDEGILTVCNFLNSECDGVCTFYADEELYENKTALVAAHKVYINDPSNYEATLETAKSSVFMVMNNIIRGVEKLYEQ
ncbi:MAG: hypothetical protein J6Q85_00350 [Clostridia bacterium]|nr:hypothetical protein [Clostridia bacterium]